MMGGLVPLIYKNELKIPEIKSLKFNRQQDILQNNTGRKAKILRDIKNHYRIFEVDWYRLIPQF